jgi:hypothetical protein
MDSLLKLISGGETENLEFRGWDNIIRTFALILIVK